MEDELIINENSEVQQPAEDEDSPDPEERTADNGGSAEGCNGEEGFPGGGDGGDGRGAGPGGVVAMPPLSTNQRIMEAVLFAVPGSVELGMLASACGTDRREAAKEIEDLKDYLEKSRSGMLIKQTGDSYELYTNPLYFDNVVRVVTSPRKPHLTDVMMETLAIVAEKERTTRVEIEKIRGVKSDFAVNKLVEYGLIEEKGRMNVPGRPIIFGPTDEFYRRFGVDADHPVPGVDEETEVRIREEAREEADSIANA